MNQLNSTTTTVECGRCGQKLRIPVKRNLEVTCPTCGNIETHYQVPPDYRMISFMCSETGQRYQVLFSKKPSDTKYKVKGVSRNDVSTNAPGIEANFKIIEERDYDISDFDFTGIYCGGCGWKREEREGVSDFVLCDKCNNYVCTKNTHIVGSEKIFRCSKSCGRTGTVTESLKTVKSEAFEGKTQKIDAGRSKQQLVPSFLRVLRRHNRKQLPE